MKPCYVLLITLLLAPGWVEASPTVEQAYMRAVPPQQTTAAIYLQLNNPDAQQLTLMGASSSVAEVAELHAHQHEKGVMSMRRVAQVDVPAASRVVFKPGGLHLMLIGLKKRLLPGESVDLTLLFTDQDELAIDVPVLGIGEEAPVGHHHQ